MKVSICNNAGLIESFLVPNKNLRRRVFRLLKKYSDPRDCITIYCQARSGLNVAIGSNNRKIFSDVEMWFWQGQKLYRKIIFTDEQSFLKNKKNNLIRSTRKIYVKN